MEVDQDIRMAMAYNNNDFREQIIDTAKVKGFWSIWMTVFHDDADMCRRLIQTFSGTCVDCFDAAKEYIPVPRDGGRC